MNFAIAVLFCPDVVVWAQTNKHTYKSRWKHTEPVLCLSPRRLRKPIEGKFSFQVYSSLPLSPCSWQRSSAFGYFQLPFSVSVCVWFQSSLSGIISFRVPFVFFFFLNIFLIFLFLGIPTTWTKTWVKERWKTKRQLPAKRCLKARGGRRVKRRLQRRRRLRVVTGARCSSVA